jgi:glycosyltransferase involved in cell wall biosynthesis
MILLSHPTGNANVRQAALALARANLLGELWTTVTWNPDGWCNSFLPAWMAELFSRRAFPPEVRMRARTLPYPEICRLTLKFIGLDSIADTRAGRFGIDTVCHRLDCEVARRIAEMKGLSGVYAYEGSAALTFKAAVERGLPRFYDMPIGHWKMARAIYLEEQDREPEWAGTLSGLRDDSEKAARKDEELSLASVVIVASTFARRSLDDAGCGQPTVHVIPYGAPTPRVVRSDAAGGGKLRVLYVGGLNQRKGISYLIRALGMLRNAVDVTLIGMKPKQSCEALESALRRHRWIPTLSHKGVLGEMARHDVLVLPSLFEGFGLVLLEAMSQGIPVIATPHTGAPDFVSEGRDGFVVPIRSAEAIAEKLDRLAGDRELLSEMKAAAIDTARRCSWGDYRVRLREVVSEGLRMDGTPVRAGDRVKVR